MLALPAALGALCLAQPGFAADRRQPVNVAERRLDRAIVEIGRQTGASIGFRDPSLAGLAVNPVSGARGAEQALARALKGTGARARRVAADTFLIERAPVAKARPAPRPKPPPEAPAPEAPAPDILVTATKQPTRLQDYAGTVTVLPGDTITLSQAARGTEAIAERAPGLTTTHLGPGRNKLFIRGVADSSFNGPTQGTVGQYWGDTRMSYSAPDPNLRLHDVRAIEVLEGPQGTLYGAGALGGIVKVSLNPPSLDRFSGSLWGGGQVTSHGAAGGDVGARVDVPIVAGTLGLRALAYVGVDGGYIDDTRRELEDVNRVRTVGGRAMLRWRGLAGWTFDLNATYQRIRGDDAQYAYDGGDRLSRGSALAQPFGDRYALGEFVARGKVGGVDFVSATGVVDQRIDEVFDATNGRLPIAYDQSSSARLVTSETRLSGRVGATGSWVGGVSALSNVSEQERTLAPEGASVPPRFGVRTRVREATLFGEATIPLRDWLRVTAGARATQSWLVSTGGSRLADPGEALTVARRDVFRVLPSAAVTVEPAPGLIGFVRYQQSYRPGGLALRGAGVQRFFSDGVRTTETGVRYAAPGGRTTLGVTLAGTHWSDIQADSIDQFGFPATNNIGDGRILSVMVMGRWRPTRTLALDGTLYFNDSRVTQVAPNTGLTEVRGTLPNVADLTGRFGAEWRHAVSGAWEIGLNASARYVGRSRLGVGPQLGKLQGDYVDATFGVRAAGPGLGVSLDVTNLFDSRGARFALGSPFQLRTDAIVPQRPRMARLGIDVSF